MADTNTTPQISLPALLLATALIFVAYRLFFSSSNSSSSSSSHNSSSSALSNNGGMRFTPAQADTVLAMFPQLSRRDVMWDLQRNRGAVGATVERVLGGRGLDAAPPSFQPPPSFMSGSATTAATAGAASTPQKKEMDLITRYNLQSRVRETTGEDGGEETAMQQKKQAQGWTSDKVERQKVLLARRDEMILKARRRMEEKDRKEKVEEGSGS